MGNHVVGKVFERRSFIQTNNDFEDRRFFRGSIDSRGRRRGETNVRFRFLHNIRDQMIAAQHSSRRIQQHQVGRAVRESERRQRLQRQREARLGEDRAPFAQRKSQSKESVAPDALRIPFTIQRAGSGESIR